MSTGMSTDIFKELYQGYLSSVDEFLEKSRQSSRQKVAPLPTNVAAAN